MKEHMIREYDDADIAAMQAAEVASDKKQKRTPEQIEAIYASGQNILVSASAGSGKTFVMVERILDQIKRGIEIDKLFVSTFTVKAAGELKERLEKKLAEAIRETQDQELRAHLAKQMAGVLSADIGTMDAFTQKVLQEHGYLLDLAPGFRILVDESEQLILKNQVFEDLFELYIEGDRANLFRRLVGNFATKANGASGFRTQVYRIYSFIQSTPDPEGWLKEVFLKGNQNLDFDAAREEIEALLREQLSELEDRFRFHLTNEAPLFKRGKYLDNVEEAMDLLAQIGGRPNLDLAQEIVRLNAQSGGKGFNLAARPKDEDLIAVKNAYNDEKKALIEAIKQTLAQLELLIYQERFQGEALEILEIFRDFLLDFNKDYVKEKMTEQTLEFADVSHLAIRILREFPQVRQAYQDRYYQVMVDEYQDTNHIQEEMLQLLSNGHNLFMVGDIKQSIYRFRQADPQIFRQKLNRYPENPKEGRLIVLKENFRSHEAVLETTNQIFKRLMDDAVGEVDYNDLHYLKAGSSGQLEARPDFQSQFFIYDGDIEEGTLGDTEEASDEDDGLPISKGQIDIVIKEIIRLHNEEGVSFKDIALLVSSRTRNDLIAQKFEEHGIPLLADQGQGSFLQALEVKVMLDTLRVLDNPRQDHALVALLKSPMFGWQEDALARIALQSDQGLSFYEKMELADQGAGDEQGLVTAALQKDLDIFLRTLHQWRDYSKTHSLYQLIWRIYQDRLYYDVVGAMPNGAKRQANLYALTVRADAFEHAGFKGLPRFVSQIEKILQVEKDLADVVVEAPEDAVQLMTIHKSKGLEFDYVFLLNMDKSFNAMDLREPVVLSRNQGIGVRYIGRVATGVEDPHVLESVRLAVDTLPYERNVEELKRADLSEQMRLLYVAMTRAAKKLYLVGSGSQEKLEAKYPVASENGRLKESDRLLYKSFQDWFLAIEAAFGERDLALKTTYVTDADLTEDTIGRLELTTAIPVDDLKDNRQSEQISRALDLMEQVDQVNQRYAAARDLPSVRTPSQVKKLYEPVQDQEAISMVAGLEAPQVQDTLEFDLPIFDSKDSKVTGAQLGSAIHALMQALPLESELTPAVLKETLDQIDADEAVKKKVDLEKIARFFETSLGLEMQANAALVRRETPFAMLKQDPISKEDFVLRGIIDGFIDYGDRLVLFDYKTDRYREPLDLVERYRNQMQLYGDALRATYGDKPLEAYLVLLGGGIVEVVQVNLEEV